MGYLAKRRTNPVPSITDRKHRVSLETHLNAVVKTGDDKKHLAAATCS